VKSVLTRGDKSKIARMVTTRNRSDAMKMVTHFSVPEKVVSFRYKIQVYKSPAKGQKMSIHAGASVTS